VSEPRASVSYQWFLSEGNLAFGLSFGEALSDAVPLKGHHRGHFSLTVTKPLSLPVIAAGSPDGQPILRGQTTLFTNDGNLTWNTLALAEDLPPTPNAFQLQCGIDIWKGACPQPLDAWKHNTRRWPTSALILGNSYPGNFDAITYKRGQLLDILRSPSDGGGDASMLMARQLVATKLNFFNGSLTVPAMEAVDFSYWVAIDADNLLGGNPLPQRVDPSSSLGQEMTSQAALLETYNDTPNPFPNLVPACSPPQ
jgi:hypothetical protein